MLNSAKNLLDKIGIMATSLCAIHCLLLPLILPLFPLLGMTVLADARFERGFLSATMVLGFFALYSGYKQYHNRLYPFIALFAGGFIYWNKDLFGEAVEPLTVMVGALLVVYAHIVNMKLSRNEDKSCATNAQCGDC